MEKEKTIAKARPAEKAAEKGGILDTLTREQRMFAEDVAEISSQLYETIYRRYGSMTHAIDTVMELAAKFHEEVEKGVDWCESDRDWAEEIEAFCDRCAEKEYFGLYGEDEWADGGDGDEE